jgi:formate dehydrogenase iron-sulfur subunit
MKLSRRTFFKVAGATGAAAVVASPRPAGATELAAVNAERRGVLVDTTLCTGCRGCEAACAEANGLPEPGMATNPAVFDQIRSTDTRTFTVVNRASGSTPARFIKRQCMHCVEPACASACLVRALDKTPTGPVVYNKSRCLGCRYCMVACPFGVPKFEYEKAAPYIQKCTFCASRQAEGKPPACAGVCPSGALTFGKRDELLEMARERMYRPGSRYVRHIYGEHEVGGTSWLYLTDVPFEKLGLPTDVGIYAYSSLTQASLAAVPFVLTLWPPLLMGLYTFSQRRAEAAKAESHTKEHHDE